VEAANALERSEKLQIDGEWRNSVWVTREMPTHTKNKQAENKLLAKKEQENCLASLSMLARGSGDNSRFDSTKS